MAVQNASKHYEVVDSLIGRRGVSVNGNCHDKFSDISLIKNHINLR